MSVTDSDIIEFARNEGTALVGFAPVSRFKDAPKGYGPCDFLPEAICYCLGNGNF